MKVKRIWMFVCAVVGCAIQALLLTVIGSEARAQDVFSSSPAPDTGGNSGKTGTQGVAGNPFCPPPVIIIDGVPTTPRNWSCRGDEQSYQATPHAPPADVRPGLPSVSSSPNPCQPGGPGGYNFLDNPVGSALPPGCVRTAEGGGGVRETKTTYDPYYANLPQNPARPAPMPVGEISPGYDSEGPSTRRDNLPTGQISPGYDSEGPSTTRRDTMPTGQISPGYDSEDSSARRDTMPTGQISPGYESENPSTLNPPMREERTSPDVGFSVQIYR